MDERLVQNAILNFFSTRTDIFGEKCIYEDFESKPRKDVADGENSLPLYGRIVYKNKQGKSCKSLSVILKITPEKRNSKFISFSFINEMNFYTKIIPAMNIVDTSFSSMFPRFLHGEMLFKSNGDQAVIIMENLQEYGYKLAEKKSFLDFHHLMLMMRKLGEFHAFSYRAKMIIPNLYYPLTNGCLETNPVVNWEVLNNLKVTCQRGRKHLQQNEAYCQQAILIEKKLQKADNIFKKVLTGDKTNQISVLCHGDYLRNNVMFRYENNVPVDMKFIDMATCRIASPIVDLATVLYLNTDQETRNQYWDLLIDEYYKALKNKFPSVANEIPTKHEIINEFNGKSLYGYLVASYFLPFLIADDLNIPFPQELSVPEFHKLGVYELPQEYIIKLGLLVGGEESTKALGDILMDMIDRGFICK